MRLGHASGLVWFTISIAAINAPTMQIALAVVDSAELPPSNTKMPRIKTTAIAI